jgi:hypothetical protein
MKKRKKGFDVKGRKRKEKGEGGQIAGEERERGEMIEKKEKKGKER